LPSRIFITGGPRSGKTPAARRLGAALGLTVKVVDCKSYAQSSG